MKRHLIELTLTAEDDEVVELLRDLWSRFGHERLRTKTRELWLAEAERAPLPPFTRQVTNYMRRGR